MAGFSQTGRLGKGPWIFVPLIFALATLALVQVASSKDAAQGLSGGAHKAVFTCGQGLGDSVKLAEDLSNCPGDGLAAKANGITIDLGGHTISGSRGGIGINVGIFSSVTIRNGWIRSFEDGIRASRGSRQLRLQSLRVSSNGHYGILTQARTSIITGNAVFANGYTGIYLAGDGRGSRITDNTVEGNQLAAIEVHEPRVFVSGNRVLSNGTGIYSFSRGGVISNNIANGNDHSGILLPRSDGTIFHRLSDNKAYYNTEYGISAAAGTYDLGGNRAGGNGERHQCENVVCS